MQDLGGKQTYMHHSKTVHDRFTVIISMFSTSLVFLDEKKKMTFEGDCPDSNLFKTPTFYYI